MNEKYTIKPIGQLWEQFWHSLNGKGWEALWDVEAERAVGQEFQVFSSSLDKSLPLVDLGCGTGIQTQFLSLHYPKVIGLDISSTAIQIAQENNNAPNLSYLIFNALNQDDARKLKEKYGDMNVYLRGVLHFIPHEYRKAFLATVQLLLGQKGKLYIIETLPEIRAYILSLASSFSKLPLRIKLALKSNLPPLGVKPAEIETYFKEAGFNILHQSTAKMATNLEIAGKDTIFLPGFQMIIGRE